MCGDLRIAWPAVDIAYHQHTRFNESLARMVRSGGVPQQAARRVYELIGRAGTARSPADLGGLTHHGESRIPHCVKFDLPGYHRLVCVVSGAVLMLLHVGSHDDCDRWLNENRGLRVLVDKETRRITVVSEVKGSEPLPPRRLNAAANLERPLLDSLSNDHLDRLPVRPLTLRKLMQLRATSGDDDLVDALAAVADSAEQDLLLSVLLALRDGHIEGAEALIDNYVRRTVPAESEPEILQQALSAEINADAVVSLRDLSEVEIEHLFNRSSFRDWLVFLHPDQKRLATMRFEGPAVLTGVSGSGKTSVLVHRARHLAQAEQGGQILIVALNGALAALIRQLVDDLCTPEIAGRIAVLAIPALCEQIVRHFEPDRALLSVDPRSREDLEDCWDDSFAWHEQQETLAPILRSLRQTHGIDAVRYIRDEFIWVRSALRVEEGPDSVLLPRSAYLEPDLTPREGRAIPFSGDWRRRILAGLGHYEEWMEVGGFVDAAGLSLEAHRHVGDLRAGNHPFRYRAVLVDEMQDLGCVELEIVRALAPDMPDSLLLSGDIHQQVYPKHHNIAQAGIKVQQGDRRFLRKNYRNTRQILEAGLALLEQFGAIEQMTDAERRAASPELSVREGARPLALQAPNRSSETQFVSRYIAEQVRAKPDAPVCIVVCGVREDNPKQLAAIQANFVADGLAVQPLTADSLLSAGGIYLSALETVKGFEFGLVVITRCGARHIPDIETPPEERWREARRLYVAMTRGRDEVLFTWAGEPSEYLAGMGDLIQMSTIAEQGLTSL